MDELGLKDAIGTFVHEWSLHYDTSAEFHSIGMASIRLGGDADTHLYRIAQEALNNIAKHAKAKSVNVLLEKRDEEVVLILEDDGIGFLRNQERDVTKSGKGLGLRRDGRACVADRRNAGDRIRARTRNHDLRQCSINGKLNEQ